jgi:hypothetical protein
VLFGRHCFVHFLIPSVLNATDLQGHTFRCAELRD